MASVDMFNHAVRVFCIALGATALQHLIFPQQTWTLGFYPKGTPTVKDDSQWILTLRVFGSYMIALVASLLFMPAEGLLIAGVTTIGSLLWHQSVNILAWILTTIITTVGVVAVATKYTGSKTPATVVPGQTIPTSIRSLASVGMKIVSWIFLAQGLQELIVPQLCWMLYYPSTTPKSTEMWLYTLRCMGALTIALSAKLMDFSNEVVLTTAAVGVMFSNWYHKNFGFNPPTILPVAALSLGVYGLMARRSFTMPNLVGRRRNVPIQSRVQ